jgi:hypothetical protein
LQVQESTVHFLFIDAHFLIGFFLGWWADLVEAEVRLHQLFQSLLTTATVNLQRLGDVAGGGEIAEVR